MLRALIVGPEVVAGLLPLAGYVYSPALFDVLAKPMRESLMFGLVASALPIGMLAFNYRESHELLSPTDSHKLLLEWPDYPMLRVRVVLALGWCIVAIAASLVAVLMVAMDYRALLAASVLVGAILSAAAATASIGLARIRLREVLGGR